MRKFSILAAVLVSLLVGGARVAQAANDLQVYFIDVDGGQSTLFVLLGVCLFMNLRSGKPFAGCQRRPSLLVVPES